MKRVILSAILAFFLFSSFRTNSNAVKPAGVSFQIDETEIQTGVEYFLCNGDVVAFPEITVHAEGHGVLNGQIDMVNVAITYTGTGVSTITGEVYTLNDVDYFHQKLPIVNGALVFKDKYVGVLTGDQGSKDNFVAITHIALNAKGVTTSFHSTFTPDCQ